MDIREDDEYILGEESTDLKSSATGSVMRCFRKFFYAIIAIGLVALLVFQIILISSAVDVVAVKSLDTDSAELPDVVTEEEIEDALADAINDFFTDDDVADQTEVVDTPTDDETVTVDDPTPVADPVAPAADPVTPAADTTTPAADTTTPVVEDPAQPVSA